MSVVAFSSTLSRPSSRRLSCRVRVIWPTRASISSDSQPSGLAACDTVTATAEPTNCVSTSGSRFVEFFEYLRELLVECGRGERFDDVAAGAGLRRSDDVFLLGLGGHHQDRQLGQGGIGTDVLQNGQAIQVRQVPVGHDEIEIPGTQLGQAVGTVF